MDRIIGKGSLYTPNRIDFKTQPIFFGDGKNVQRYEDVKYPFFDSLAKEMWKLHWTEDKEVDLTKDKNDFQTLSLGEQHIFVSNIKFQTLLDSIQGRAPILTFGQVQNLPEIEDCLTKIQAFEVLHSRSYTHILRNIFTKPSEILDQILIDDMILERSNEIIKYYDEFYYDVLEYQIMCHKGAIISKGFMEKIKTSLYLALINLNILEGIRFYVSFACSFAFAENKKMEGNAKIIKFIARDENKHLEFSQKLINILRKIEAEGFINIIPSLENKVYDMYDIATSQENNWADYLFKNGSLIGLNAPLLKQYMKYITNNRLKAIGYKPIFDKTENSLTWMSTWLSSKGTENLLQETDNTSYLVGALKDDVSNMNMPNYITSFINDIKHKS